MKEKKVLVTLPGDVSRGRRGRGEARPRGLRPYEAWNFTPRQEDGAVMVLTALVEDTKRELLEVGEVIKVLQQRRGELERGT